MALLNEKECVNMPKDCNCGNCYGIVRREGVIEAHYCNGNVARVESDNLPDAYDLVSFMVM